MELAMENHPLYSRISAVYDSVFWYFFSAGNEAGCNEIARRGITEVLEIGIGTGFSLEYYAAKTKVIGIDLNPSMLEEAQKRARRRANLDVELRAMDAQALDFDDNRFDCVFLPSVLTVVPDPEKTVAEAVRVLKPGGLLLAVCHLTEESKMPPALRKQVDPLTRRLFGFTMNLSEECFRKRSDLKIESVEPTNVVMKSYPLSFLVKAIKV